jgi:hypothetical protein
MPQRSGLAKGYVRPPRELQFIAILATAYFLDGAAVFLAARATGK